MFILQSVTQDEMSAKISDESTKLEKRRENVLKWGDSIDMVSALAPALGSRIL
ncbi:uncharacterized protein NEMAJ01_0284 [Nematocida major]|uniref:uncharacterized protein n=1 Tax=Nematocida major TaxID=1912982 RepID=UPI0020083E09|nr:uncharacterized protein NEMAJ01_0284 [Nematocida major]KAH9385388.1 hypothetical protein NEMAJ01_0284 [Nematocida major]